MGEEADGGDVSGGRSDVAVGDVVKVYLVEPDEGAGGPVFEEVMEDLGEEDPVGENFYEKREKVVRYRQGGSSGNTG